MSNTRCDIYNWLLVPAAITALLSLTVKNGELELGLTYALCVLSTLAHIHYGTCLVSTDNTLTAVAKRISVLGKTDVPTLPNKMLQDQSSTFRLTTCRQRVKEMRCPSELNSFVFMYV